MQYATSVVLIAGTIIVFQQCKLYAQPKLGVRIITAETLVCRRSAVSSRFTVSKRFSTIKTALLQLPGVQYGFFFTSDMGKEIYWTNGR
jgi:hypothetical protein